MIFTTTVCFVKMLWQFFERGSEGLQVGDAMAKERAHWVLSLQPETMPALSRSKGGGTGGIAPAPMRSTARKTADFEYRSCPAQ